jgi:CHAT domain-containing protein
MSNSYSHQIRTSCPRCHQSFSVDAWLIVDKSEHPELGLPEKISNSFAEQLLESQLNKTYCPYCSYIHRIAANTLIYQPGEFPPALFVLSQDLPDDELQDQAYGLLTQLHSKLPPAEQRALHGPIMIIKLEDEFGQSLRSLAIEFFTASSWEVSQYIVEQNPDLLSDKMELLFQAMIQGAREEGDRNLEKHFQEHLDLLQQCRKLGIHAAFANKVAWPGASEQIRSALYTAKVTEYLVEQGKKKDQLDAVQAWERILNSPSFKTAPPDIQDAILNDAAGSFFEQYEVSGEKAYLDRSLEIYFYLETSSEHNDKSSHNLATTLIERYKITGNTGDLNHAVTILENLARSPSIAKDDYVEVLNTLADTLRIRYQQTGNETDLHKGLQVSEEALKFVTANHPSRASHLNNNGLLWRNLYHRSGEIHDLDKAIARLQEAEKITHGTPLTHSRHSSNLGLALLDRYTRAGQLEDLDRAILSLENAVGEKSASFSEVTTWLTNLAIGLHDRYNATGSIDDLLHAIRVAERIQAQLPPDSISKRECLNILASSLLDYFDHTEKDEYLDRAVDIIENAIKLAHPDSLQLPYYMNTLASCLRTRYIHRANIHDLQKMSDLYNKAILMVSQDSIIYRVLRANQGATYLNLYIETAEDKYLSASINTLQQDLQTEPNSPQKAQVWINLGRSLLARHLTNDNQDDREQAIAAFTKGCQIGMESLPRDVLDGSLLWGNWAFEQHNWEESIRGFQPGLQVIENLLRTQLLRFGKETWLQKAQELHLYYSFALSATNNLPEAITALEAGRARLLAEGLERNRLDLAKLPVLGHTELYKQYQRSIQQVAHLETVGVLEENLPANFDQFAELHSARKAMDEAIEAIRKIPGYEDFLQSWPFEKIKAVSEKFPLVYINITSSGGVIFLLNRGSATQIKLSLTEKELNSILIETKQGEIVGGYLPAQLGFTSMPAALEKLLSWQKEKIIIPLVNLLRDIGLKEIVIIPTRKLALLPLHATAYVKDGKECTLLDDYVVSYAPSARALFSGYEMLKTINESKTDLCAIGNPLPLPENVMSLIFARAEAEEIALLFGGETKSLLETEATRMNIEQRLGKTSYIHFACHGYFNPDKQLGSGLLLSNGEKLTLQDIMDKPRATQTRLVVLSACQTAITDFNKLPEEAIGLPAGFLQAGIPGVVGSLWPVDDLSTALLMIRFYQSHIKDHLRPAEALRQAQLWLRDANNEELSKLFAMYRNAAKSPQTRMNYELAQKKFREHTLADPEAKPFSHPYYWAGFVFYGI